ncbi:hypothetical protein LIER_18093 [Lithospermum erythrorhizon]|uniref:RNase H type-1 domain-containing protein n=1 Tax=Lithospermum erythrorhizon TaxID=34254 RepID=A0AAV3QFB3_LITER
MRALRRTPGRRCHACGGNASMEDVLRRSSTLLILRKPQLLEQCRGIPSTNIRVKAAIELDIHRLEIYGDSQLVINQLQGDYEVWKPELIPYDGYAKSYCNLST